MSGSQLGLSFGRVAAVYHRVRPSYSKASLDRAQEALELGAEARVLDLAAGTGKLTGELALRFRHVVAVEPDDAMRELITDGEVLPGSAEAIPFSDASVDAVFVGEAIHWFDAPEALREIARVLKPRGGVALFSNIWWHTVPPLPYEAQELLRAPFVSSGRADVVETWREAFALSPFEPLRDEVFTEVMPIDPDTLLDLYSTTSSLAAMPVDERVQLLAQVRSLLDGPYRLPIRSELTWTRLA